MEDKDMEHTKALFIVVNAGFAERIVEIARSEGAGGATIINARGEGLNVEKIMGITVDSEKEMVLSLVDGNTAAKIMSAVKDKAGICTPAHGICFVLSVEQMIGSNQQ
jgi:nitrogen regulatory protein P-II 1